MSSDAGLTNNQKMTFGVVYVFTLLFLISYIISQTLTGKPDNSIKSVESFFAEFEINFQGNNGSFANDVKYYSKGYQFDLMFMDREVLLNLYSTDPVPPGSPSSTNSRTQLSQVSLEFLNANKAPEIKGLSEFVPTRVSAVDPASQNEDSPSFKEIKYSNIYPGIDVYFSGKQKQLFYEFILSDSADVNDVILKVSGLDAKSGFDVDMHGNITVNCRGKQMEIRKPEVYRVIKQVKQRINGYFIVTPANELRFKTIEETNLL